MFAQKRRWEKTLYNQRGAHVFLIDEVIPLFCVMSCPALIGLASSSASFVFLCLRLSLRGARVFLAVLCCLLR